MGFKVVRFRAVQEDWLQSLEDIIREMNEIGLEDDRHRALGLLEDIWLVAPKIDAEIENETNM